MVIAIIVEISSAAELQPGLGVALGIELHQLHPVRGDIGEKRDEVSLGHFVPQGHEMLVFDIFYGESVIFIGSSGYSWSPIRAATANSWSPGKCPTSSSSCTRKGQWQFTLTATFTDCGRTNCTNNAMRNPWSVVRLTDQGLFYRNNL